MKINKNHLYYNLENKNIENFTQFELLTGNQGDKGRRGNEGDVGVMGSIGGRGAKGLPGDKGELGQRGIIGPSGIKGDTGIEGNIGKEGMRGIRGQRGDQGGIGPPGDPGPPGPIGFTGKQGARGDIGDRGDKGKAGDSGYDGSFMVDYNKCFWANNYRSDGWNFNHTNAKQDNSWKKERTIKCPSGHIVTEMETNCYCWPRKGGGLFGGNYGKNFTPDYQLSLDASKNRICPSMYDRKDCKHRIKCCPLTVYDIPEPIPLRQDRLDIREQGEEERVYNIMWISMKPINFYLNENNLLANYPGIFSSDVTYDRFAIESDKDESITSNLVLPKTTGYNEIPNVKDCPSNKCSIVGQLCTKQKICLDKPNLDTECRIPPCWHNIPKKTNDCPLGRCDQLGQYCGRDNGRICTNNSNPEESCFDPPCWNKVPIINSCEGSRCIYEGQQCGAGITDMNFTGFKCLNERNDFYASDSEPCTNPPCWHKINDIIEDIDDENSKCLLNSKCNFISQKCKIGGTKEDPIERICLNNKTDECLNPPCWFDIPRIDTLECPPDTIPPEQSCRMVDVVDNNGNLMKDTNGGTMVKPGPCNFKGSCPIQGSKCKTKNAQFTNGNWTGVKECVNSFRSNSSGDIIDDSAMGAELNPLSCEKKPCWIDPIQNTDYIISDQINKYNEDGTNIVKSDTKIKLLKDQSKKKGKVYIFNEEDKTGYITKDMLLNFMTQNWKIFEANVLNINLIWDKFKSKDNEMNYLSFTSMMRSLKVETFKFKNNKRIVPRPISEAQKKSLESKYLNYPLNSCGDKIDLKTYVPGVLESKTKC